MGFCEGKRKAERADDVELGLAAADVVLEATVRKAVAERKTDLAAPAVAIFCISVVIEKCILGFGICRQDVLGFWGWIELHVWYLGF